MSIEISQPRDSSIEILVLISIECLDHLTLCYCTKYNTAQYNTIQWSAASLIHKINKPTVEEPIYSCGSIFKQLLYEKNKENIHAWNVNVKIKLYTQRVSFPEYNTTKEKGHTYTKGAQNSHWSAHIWSYERACMMIMLKFVWIQIRLCIVMYGLHWIPTNKRVMPQKIM